MPNATKKKSRKSRRSGLDRSVRDRSGLGRLTVLGPQTPDEVAWLLPRTWDDLNPVITQFSPAVLSKHLGEKVVLRGRLCGPPNIHYQPVPRSTAWLRDARGQSVSFAIFGNTEATEQQLRDHAQNLCLTGTVGMYQNTYELNNVTLIPAQWAGRLRPRYPGKPSVIGADLVRDRVLRHLSRSIPKVAEALTQQLGGDDSSLNHLIAPFPTLEAVLRVAHIPKSLSQGQQAQAILDQLNAIAVVRQARCQNQHAHRPSIQVTADWQPWAEKLPFTLTDDQVEAIETILADLQQTTPMHRLLSGDVGSGKTAVYGVVAATMRASTMQVSTMQASGGRVAILAPNTNLVAQISANIQTWWPELNALAVTGRTDKKRPLKDESFLIGTTALLHRNTGHFDLVVVDEQHKFSRAQREQLQQSGCHLLEATATCTPRSQALLELGARGVSRLQGHRMAKQIITRIWGRSERPDLMAAIQSSVTAGDQVLIIYPLRGEDAEHNLSETERRRQAIQAAEQWERWFPGRVRLTHGAQSDDEKTAAITALREDQADVLVATTVVEVGIDLPELRRVVIIQADRLGLVSLHQIRGRVARTGGQGYCDLYVPEGGEAIERLDVLCRTDNGFEIAEQDLRLRGFGDLSKDSDAEKGFRDGLFFQRPIQVDAAEAALQWLDGDR